MATSAATAAAAASAAQQQQHEQSSPSPNPSLSSAAPTSQLQARLSQPPLPAQGQNPVSSPAAPAEGHREQLRFLLQRGDKQQQPQQQQQQQLPQGTIQTTTKVWIPGALDGGRGGRSPAVALPACISVCLRTKPSFAPPHHSTKSVHVART